jgi:NAD(P)-dependent dehydrogenase (short-subunit alcohol dehydrogenase family)
MTSVQEEGGEFGLPIEVIQSVEAAIPIGRAGVPDDVAGVCSWLASADSDYVCGQIVEVHGGMEIIKVAD